MIGPILFSPPPGHNPLALLVDRDVDTRQLYAECLRQASCDIEEAVDGREALAKAISRHPDVIVTETRLSGLSGFDLCTLLRQDGSTRDVPIVVVTADAFERDVQRAYAAGADIVLVKPCLREQLDEQIQRLWSRDLRERVNAVRGKLDANFKRANLAIDYAHALVYQARLMRRVRLIRAHDRHDTTIPPQPPPAAVCPTCDQPLRYVKSHIGGVSQRYQEQWDYFDCAACSGTFQYRQRTRKLRRVT